MYEILFSNQFKRSYKKCLKRGCNKALFEDIQPDWLLVWEQRDTELILILTDIGTHSDLFG